MSTSSTGTQPPNALYMGGAIIRRPLNRGAAVTQISPRPLPQSNYTHPDPSLPGHLPVQEGDTGPYRNLDRAATAIAPAAPVTAAASGLRCSAEAFSRPAM